MKLLIAGDLVPTDSNINLFESADLKALLGEELLNLWQEADERVFNLEAPITDKWNPIKKHGINLIISTKCINGIKALNPSCITLANNHILDQGESGFIATQEVLNRNKIPYVGAGNNIKEARRAHIIERDGVKVGIYSCAEQEFTIATEDTCGANPFDPLESLDHISELDRICDYVIVLYHGGKEHYRYPSPYLQRVCRKMVEKGANLIVCQHSHCIGCFEKFQDSTIIYGQGNFIFDYAESEFWQTSLIIQVNIKDKVEINYLPIIKDENRVILAEGEKAREILSGFFHRSNEVLHGKFIEEKYKNFAEKNINNYLRVFLGMNKWISRIDRYILKNKLISYKLKKKRLLAIENFIQCEAHRELLLEGLKIKNQ